jgi:hypothetical protein
MDRLFSITQWRSCIMTKNVGGIDRVVRIVAGLVLIALAATGQIGAWGWLGAVVLATGVFSFCGAYTLMGLNTCPMKQQETRDAK